jgi:glutathione S-transferase kappa 1
MSAKITAWVDCNSPYSRFAFLHIRKYAAQLAQHGVEYDIQPVFINGLNVGSGNKPPWTLPAKAKYGEFDGQRAQNFFGTGKMSAPPEFPVKTLPVRQRLSFNLSFQAAF